jgi:hypothetical protein
MRDALHVWYHAVFDASLRVPPSAVTDARIADGACGLSEASVHVFGY